ncbi:hypothetical protein AB0J20_20410 [Micromonospora costi]|uniref:hypothetical protein n=1 Tax=Micromonospora costi TaxID=1530042 RepID=UPI0033EAAFB3
MDDVRTVWWDRPEFVEALAALVVGVVFTARGLPLVAAAGFFDMVAAAPVTVVVPAWALLVLGVALAALLPRLCGWWVASGALVLLLVTGYLPEGAGLMSPSGGHPSGDVAAVLTAVGAGLALGGARLAVGQVPRVVRWLPAGGLAAGFVLQPVATAALTSQPPARYAGTSLPGHVQLWLAMTLTLLAALLAHRRAIDVPPPAPGRPRAAPVVLVAVAAALALAGLAGRSWLVRTVRLSPEGFTSHRRAVVVEAISHYSLVVAAVVVALVLLGHAFRAGGVVAARWVALGAGAGPLLLTGFPLDGTSSASRLFLVVVTGAGALTAGALLARQALPPLPLDAMGLLVAAVATPLASPMVHAELPWAVTAHPVLVTLGLGVALGFGLSHTATAVVPPPTPESGRDGPRVEPETARLVGLLVLGPVALVLCAVMVAPVVLRSQMDTPYREPVLTVPAFAAGAAVLTALLWGLQRAMARPRRAPASGAPSGPVPAR